MNSSPESSGDRAADDEESAAAGGRREVRVLLLVRERFDGACLVAPAAAPQLASLGGEAEAMEEQEVFLREHLERARPEGIARLSMPEETRLVEVGVPIPREDLPRKLQDETPVAFSCVVVPAARGDAWVMVPAIGHTFYVERGEELDEAIRHEVRRLLASQDLGAWDHRGLLPGREHRLAAVKVPLPTGDRAGQGAKRREEIARQAVRRKALRALETAAAPLEAPGRFGPAPLLGRDVEMARLSSLLEGSERLGVLLVGPEGSGKSALLRSYVHRGKRPVYATSGAQIIAGMSGFGEWQERVRDVMEAARELDAVLYIEHLEDLLAERSESGGVDIGGAMRPWIEDGKVRVVVEVREDRLDALESRHWAFFAALSRIKVEPLSAAQAREALAARVAHDRRAEPARPRLAGDAIPALVDLAERYLPYAAFPGKAARLYEDLRAIREKDLGPGGEPVTIDKADLHEAFSIRTGVPAFLLREDLPLRIDEIGARLRKHVIGQDQAVAALAETIAVVKAGLQPSGKPLATFLFIGPTGVGKTELARALADLLFGAADRMARFDMSEFMTPDAADRLIRGTDREGGLLTSRVREQPFCVILLDEIEKAHPAVFDLLLQVAGEGRLSDARGRTAYFHNAILIMTSNLGATERRSQAGFLGGSAAVEAHYRRVVDSSFRPEFVNRIDRVVAFRPLTRAEVSEVVRVLAEKIAERRGLSEAGVSLEVSPRALDRLAADGYSEAYGARALRRHLEEHLVGPLARVLAGLGGEARELSVRVTEIGEEGEAAGTAGAWGASGASGVSGASGASGAAGAATEGHLVASAEAGALRLVVRRRAGVKGARQAYGFDEVSRMRREVDGWMQLGPVQELKDEMDFLLTQLNVGPADRESGRQANEKAALQAEHHRLQEMWGRLAKAQEDVRSAEELAMTALFEGEALGPFVDEARASHAAFRRALPRAMLALEPRRDAITLAIEELDEGAFELWLAPLLRALEARGWQALVHIDGDKAPALGPPWPSDRRWGPPRTAGEALLALAQPKRSFRNVLLRCKGSYAGGLLALEAGLHRMILPRRQASEGAEDDRAHVNVQLVLLDFEIPADAWAHRAFALPALGQAATRRRGAAAREHDRVEGAVMVAGRRARVDVAAGAYWAHLEEIALEHLLLFEDPRSGLSRDEVFLPHVEGREGEGR